ncbi:hypothetical protein K3888_13280 [Dietzia aurantiaca]|uniref:hypothetical protein n=1 Tax=Dietzia aurantiaca TaxID=983873 RepID=UPI001E52A028|nr:hypothetical protein [Dietzia aurantiaca]MCD2263672.1 hypothetical protein [Dietzia aurantiaca]
MKFTAKPTFAVDKAGMQRELTGPQSQMVRLLRDTTRQTVNTAKLRAPVDTGQLRNAHRAEDVRVVGMTARTAVVADKNYAAAVHDGSRPHLIRPKNKKSLAFKVGGKTVFAQQVKHPGAKPRPWLLNATREAAGRNGFIVTPSS